MQSCTRTDARSDRRHIFQVMLVGQQCAEGAAPSRSELLCAFVGAAPPTSRDGVCVADLHVARVDVATSSGPERVTLQLWDVAGGDRLGDLPGAFFKQAAGCVWLRSIAQPVHLHFRPP